MELSGKIINILPIESGESQRGSWQKRTMVIRNDSDKYPKPVAILLWGDMVDTALSVGDEVTVHINIESREYKDRWFTDVKAWKIDRKGAGRFPSLSRSSRLSSWTNQQIHFRSEP
jgi:hypothetical protein